MKQITIAIWGKSGAGKTTTTINLGTLLANHGNSVLILSTDLEKPSLQKLFAVRIGENNDLNAVLTGTPILSAAVPTKTENLYLLGVEDKTTALDYSFLSLAQAKRLIREVGREFDFVLCDCEDGTTNPLALSGVAYADLCFVLYSRDLFSLTWLNSFQSMLGSLRPSFATEYVRCKDANQLDEAQMESLSGVSSQFYLPYTEMITIENSGAPLAANSNLLDKSQRRYLQSLKVLCQHLEAKFGGEENV